MEDRVYITSEKQLFFGTCKKLINDNINIHEFAEPTDKMSDWLPVMFGRPPGSTYSDSEPREELIWVAE